MGFLCAVDGCMEVSTETGIVCGHHRSRGKKYGTTVTKHELYGTWRAMMIRCYYAKHPTFKRYGARGIAVCAAWHDFQTFVAQIPARPTPQHTVERIENDGNYEPGNVCWATRYEQGRNRSTTKISVTDQLEMVRLRLAGTKQAEIATKFSISQGRVSALLKQHGITGIRLPREPQTRGLSA